MILAVDVDYKGNEACIAGVAFSSWSDSEAMSVYASTLSGIEEYVPGYFYRRELPCILALLREHELTPDVIVVDGFVYLDGYEEAGLGKRLYDELNGSVDIVGVAKKPFKGISTEYELFRGDSKKPLYVTSEGIPVDHAKASILSMHGKYREPTLLKYADRVCRSWVC
ncbi:endonuclease V [Gammaproteobacteria bacterium 45_16_T64]|nr:endonuclease V [Gammaproteobacteria bacterium 45_16_T64]